MSIPQRISAKDVHASQAPQLLRFITCGSVDDGKSTLIGRLLYESKSIFEDQLESLDKDSRKFGTQGAELDLALLVDGLAAEREQGITIDVAYRYFSTPNRAFIVADTPGHEQYTRNMATGASSADLAIILVDARKGILPQTRRHSFIVSMLGVRHIAVAINKMDLVGFDRAVFAQIEADYRVMAASLGFESVRFIPVSALQGDNVTTRSAATAWYDGPTLLEHLETVDTQTAAELDAPLRFPVQWVNRPNLDFRGYAGTIAQGTVKVGDEVSVVPRGRRSHIARIVTADGDLQEASAGQAVTLTLTDEIDVSRGDVLIGVVDRSLPRRDLRVRLLWTVDRPLISGARYLLKLATSTAEARVDLHQAIDIHSFTSSPARELAMNGIGIAHLTLDRMIFAADYRQTRDLGGLILIDRITNETVAFGLVESGPDDEPQRSLAEKAHALGLFVAGSLFGNPSEPLERSLADRLSWAVTGAIILGAVVYVISGNAALSFGVAAIDFVVRPVLRLFHRRLVLAVLDWRALRKSEDLADGGGI